VGFKTKNAVATPFEIDSSITENSYAGGFGYFYLAEKQIVIFVFLW